MAEKTSEETSSKMITLKTADGVVIEVEPNIAMEIKKVQSFIDESKAVTANPLPKVFSKQLATIVNYCKKHGAVETNFAKDKFDAEFLKELRCDDMKNLFLAARYLNIRSLLDFLVQIIVNESMNKSVEFAREILDEEADHKENGWSFKDIYKD